MQKIKVKPIQHGMVGYAPFVSTLVANTKWGDDRPTPLAKKLIKDNNIHVTPKCIVDAIVKHDDSQGIVLGGMNWMLDIDSLIAILKEVAKTDLEILIAVPTGLEQFETAIGISASKETGEYDKLEKMKILDDDNDIYKFIGARVMDEIIGRDYLMLTGMYNDVKLFEMKVNKED